MQEALVAFDKRYRLPKPFKLRNLVVAVLDQAEAGDEPAMAANKCSAMIWHIIAQANHALLMYRARARSPLPNPISQHLEQTAFVRSAEISVRPSPDWR